MVLLFCILSGSTVLGPWRDGSNGPSSIAHLVIISYSSYYKMLRSRHKPQLFKRWIIQSPLRLTSESHKQERAGEQSREEPGAARSLASPFARVLPKRRLLMMSFTR